MPRISSDQPVSRRVSPIALFAHSVGALILLLVFIAAGALAFGLVSIDDITELLPTDILTDQPEATPEITAEAEPTVTPEPTEIIIAPIVPPEPTDGIPSIIVPETSDFPTPTSAPTAPPTSAPTAVPAPISPEHRMLNGRAMRDGLERTNQPITRIFFIDELTFMQEDALDVSAAKDGSVMLWIAPYVNDEFILCIAAEGGVILPADCSSLFEGCASVREIIFSETVDASKVTTMSRMFAGCSSLTAIDLSTFDTSNVTDMSHMLSGCSSLTAIDLSSFDTSNVTDMSYMFEDCSSMTQLDLSSFCSSLNPNMDYMFCGCRRMKKITAERSFEVPRAYENTAFKDCGAEDITYPFRFPWS
jgi:surface protein